MIRPLVDPRLFANGMMEILVGPLLQLAPLSRRVYRAIIINVHHTQRVLGHTRSYVAQHRSTKKVKKKKFNVR